MIDLKLCPVCKNTELQINSCTFEGKTYAYNVFCLIVVLQSVLIK